MLYILFFRYVFLLFHLSYYSNVYSLLDYAHGHYGGTTIPHMAAQATTMATDSHNHYHDVSDTSYDNDNDTLASQTTTTMRDGAPVAFAS
jgi:hypothetical protein